MVCRTRLRWDLDLVGLVQEHFEGAKGSGEEEVTAAQLSLFKHWKSLAEVEDQGLYLFTDHTRLEAFWRTLWLDRFRVDGEGTVCFRRIPKLENDSTYSFNSRSLKDGETVRKVLAGLLAETVKAYRFADVNLYGLIFPDLSRIYRYRPPKRAGGG
ncbi:hypothetical protein GGTG_06497 [Gaeumannomyces tritici R3-111a-1]|uniref:Uncharacterized protein n=1 Tax=Gaeumannomyces tritici (strain R3-111a-1) TaxID=644352 RepID=J3NYZ6_GAET3|nr:hypothetical protein GGTG_06497 [Gaeumannomyces tritici R3-111a-1]EJT76579.1 hypothetical protein GGTG_06497 [Gaeumannomyces tritici R3-111a-1]